MLREPHASGASCFESLMLREPQHDRAGWLSGHWPQAHTEGPEITAVDIPDRKEYTGLFMFAYNY